MAGLLLSKVFVEQFGDRLEAAARAAGIEPRVIHFAEGADSTTCLAALEARAAEMYATLDRWSTVPA